MRAFALCLYYSKQHHPVKPALSSPIFSAEYRQINAIPSCIGRSHTLILWLTLIILLSACQATPRSASKPSAVVAHYTEIAHAVYEDALLTATTLHQSVESLRVTPTDHQLNAARSAWIAARVPYQQSEVFRFGNPVVDEWEGQVNAWPLDEGLIDYVDRSSYTPVLGNPAAHANLIANTRLRVGSQSIDTTILTPSLIARLNALAGAEANVTSGYHAIEFLLWGQDLNATTPAAGNRPATDFAKGPTCTHRHCARRGQYLWAVSHRLVYDLTYMTRLWAPDGRYRRELLKAPPEQGLRRMLFGMGSLALGELAGERMKVALEANSSEDEHDCFSDNTHASHFYNGLGIRNIYLGEYRRIDGRVLQGSSLSDLVRQRSPALDSQIRRSLDVMMLHLQAMVDRATHKTDPMPFDMMIAEGNIEGERLINASIGALVNLSADFEAAAQVLELGDLNPDHVDATH